MKKWWQFWKENSNPVYDNEPENDHAFEFVMTVLPNGDVFINVDWPDSNEREAKEQTAGLIGAAMIQLLNGSMNETIKRAMVRNGEEMKNGNKEMAEKISNIILNKVSGIAGNKKVFVPSQNEVFAQQ